MSLSNLLSECAELPEDLDAMDTLTLRMLRDSQRKTLEVASQTLMGTSDEPAAEMQRIGERIRRINAALDRKDGLTD